MTDLRMVDYDALGMPDLSATQDLARQLKAQVELLRSMMLSTTNK